MNNLLTYKMMAQIFLYIIPGIITYHIVSVALAEIFLPIPTWLVALAFAVYVSATVYKEFNKVTAKKAVPRRTKAPKQVTVVISQAKAKKLGLV